MTIAKKTSKESSVVEWEWKCQECGKVFKSVKAAERASRNGCPNCGGVDIDIA